MMILFASDLYFVPSNFNAHSSIPLFVSLVRNPDLNLRIGKLNPHIAHSDS